MIIKDTTKTNRKYKVYNEKDLLSAIKFSNTYDIDWSDKNKENIGVLS
jgi:hypothetical protein